MQFKEITVTRYHESLWPKLGPLRAFVKVVFTGELGTFLMSDVKIIMGTNGLFVAMPARRVMQHCECGGKNVLDAQYCNWCARLLIEDGVKYKIDRRGREVRYEDIFFPVDSPSRNRFVEQVLKAYETAPPVYTLTRN